jgi:trehalose 6-phosphate synthase
MTHGDRRVAREHRGSAVEVEEDGCKYQLRFIELPASVYHGYYNVIANPLLWFLQHYMWDTPREPRIGRDEWRAWREGYVPANREFARVVSEEIGRSDRPPVVMLQDYHLYLVAGMLREEHPDVPIQFFLHIPFPGSDYLRILPDEMRREIVSSLLACDIVGVQTSRAAVNLLRAAASFVPGARVDYDRGVVEYRGRSARVREYPISVDPAAVRGTATSEEARSQVEFLAPHFGERNILRVDRIEPSKNILRGFDAYSLMLDDHPELRERVRFLAFLVPSRGGIAEYERYQDEVMAAIGRINVRHGTDRWRPVEAFIGDNYARALAAMCRYDVLLVNPVIDGMNLVAKEGVIVNERDWVLVLSEGAGTFEQFGPLPHSVSAADIEGTARALYDALMMPADRRREWAERLRSGVEEEDVARWLDHQLADIELVCEKLGTHT